MSNAPAVLVTGTAAATCYGLGSLPLWHRIARRDRARPAPASASRPFPPLPAESTGGHSRLAAYVLAALEHDLGTFLSALPETERESVGVALGSTYGYLGEYLTYLETASQEGYQLVNPRHFPRTLPNSTAVSVSDAFTLWGSSTAVATGLGAGLEAIGYAAECIRGGDEHSMLAGACEELNPATLPTTEPHRGCAAEGVGILLLQSSEAAAARDRQPLAVCGAVAARHGIWCDDPASREKAIATIQEALCGSDLSVGEVTAVFPSAGGSARGDQFEAELLERLFGRGLLSLDVVAIKPVTGECLAASGALQCLAAVQYLAQSTRADRHRPPAAALVYTCGLDGTFASAIFRSAA